MYEWSLHEFLLYLLLIADISQVIWQRTKHITLEAIAGFGQILPPWKVFSSY